MGRGTAAASRELLLTSISVRRQIAARINGLVSSGLLLALGTSVASQVKQVWEGRQVKPSFAISKS